MNYPASRHHRRTVHACAAGFLAAAVLLLAIPTAHAGSYKLVKGKGVEVCEAYQKNLNSFDHSAPMSCEREINPDMKDFQKPGWKELEAWDNRELIMKIQKFLEPANTTIGNDYYWQTLKRAINDRHVVLSITTIDIDNDSKTEIVAKYQDGVCQMAHRYGTPILVIDDKGKEVDRGKTFPLLQNESMDKEKDPAGGWGYAMYDVFRYKGNTYFDRWSDFHTEKWFLHVFKVEKNGKTDKVCSYKYVY